MKLDIVIEALQGRVHRFEGRVFGAAEYAGLARNQSVNVPCAFVIPMNDTPEESNAHSGTGYHQEIEDRFVVVVAISNEADPRGQTAITSVHDIRKELFRALLNWTYIPDTDGLSYGGGQLMGMDRGRLWYQFEFYTTFVVDESEAGDPQTWNRLELDALPEWKRAYLTVDAIDPHDPNTGEHGPDGVPEAVAGVQFETG